MLTLNDFSLLIVSTGRDMQRLEGVYQSIRKLYPDNEIVIVYDNNPTATLNVLDDNLIQERSTYPVYVSAGYNLALKHATKKCFVFLHDDTIPAKNFLENIIPHVTEQQFCNFTTVEPPLYGNPSTLLCPVQDFGRSINAFNADNFNKFCEEHVKQITNPVVESPFGGFFMAGFKSSMETVGGFDEYFRPYFHEDADLMLRLHQAGFHFVHILTSLVYHMGSLTSRGTKESDESMQTTAKLFLKKWKAPWDYVRKYTLENGIDHKNISFNIECTNCHPQLEMLTQLISEPTANITVLVNGAILTQQDVEYLQTLPYVLQSIDEEGEYELGNLKVQYYLERTDV